MEKSFITNKQTREFIKRAYDIACAHGFHDVERTNAHFLMLVVGEVGEMVEADRKRRHANISQFNDECKFGTDVYDRSTDTPFEKYVKDTLEDELADVVIRIYDLLGTRGLEPTIMDSKAMYDEWCDYWGTATVCEQCFDLCKILCGLDNASDASLVRDILGAALQWCYSFARFHDIDLVWHVTNKMEYNAKRTKLHGKQY